MTASQKVFTFIQENLDFLSNLGLWTLGFTVFLFLTSLSIVYFYIYRLSPDYFVKTITPIKSRSKIRILRQILQNALGSILILLGLIMLFTPGQGILTILTGILVMDFQKKRHYVRKILTRSNAHLHINKLRIRAGKKPIIWKL